MMQDQRARLEELRARARMEELRQRARPATPQEQEYDRNRAAWESQREDFAAQQQPARGVRVRQDLGRLVSDPLGYVAGGMVNFVGNVAHQPIAEQNFGEALGQSMPAAQLALQGASFGWGDEALGAAAGGMQAGLGGDYATTYRRNVDGARGEISANREAAPVSSFLAEGGGGAMTGGLGARFVQNAGTRLGMAGRTGLLGAGYGSVTGAGEADGTLAERAVGGAIGGGLGAALGAAAPLVTEGLVRAGLFGRRAVQGITNRVMNQSQPNAQNMSGNQRRAWEQLLDEAESAGRPPGTINSRMDMLDSVGASVDETIAEILGEPGVNRAAGGVLTGNTDAMQGRARVNARQAQQPARVRGYMRDGLGADGSEFPAVRSQLDTPTPRESQLYDEFRNQPGVRRVAIAPGDGIDVYHGTPDSRGIRETGFSTMSERANSIPRGQRRGPYFFTDKREIAATYADDTRAFDYQNAEPEVLRARVQMRHPLTIDAGGDDFRGIDVARIRQSLGGGAERAEFESFVREFEGYRNDGRLRTDDVVEAARRLGFDGIEVRNVRDSYTGDGPTSTVTAVFSDAQAAVTSQAGDALEGFMQNPRFARIAEQSAQDVMDATGQRVNIGAGEVTPEVFDAIKRRMDRAISDAEGGATRNTADSRPLRELRRRFVDFADETFPNYAPARAESQVRLSAREALEEGRQIFRTDNIRNPEEVASRVRQMTPEQLTHYRQGVARGVLDQMNSSPRNVIEAGGEVIESGARDSSNPISRFWNRADRQEALRAAFGDEGEFQQFVRRMAIESDRAENFRRLSPTTQGSPTQRNNIATQLSDGVRDIGEAAAGNPLGVALRRITQLASSNRPRQEVEQEIQRILWSSPVDMRDQLLGVLAQRGIISRNQAAALSAARSASAPATNAVLQSTQN